jgi:hypothetical protein
MMIKVATVFLVCIYLAKAIPVENETARRPVVIDIPAGPPPEDEPKPITEQKPEVTKGEGSKPESDVEIIPTDSGSDEVSDFKPTFVIIRTRPFFSSGGFGQSPFFSSPFGSSGGSLFGNSPFPFNNPMRPVNRDREPVSSSSSDSSEAVSPFDGPFNRPSHFNVDDLMTRLQQQMSSLWGTLLNPNNRPRPVAPFRPFNVRPFNPFDSSAEETGTASNNTSSEEVFNIDKLPANYTNSTSETKVIDGNVVQVNRTIHKISSGNNTRGFFQFQVINVKPQTTPTTEKVEGTVDEVPAATGDVEKEKPETVPSTPSAPAPAAPEADPSLNEVDEKKAGGIDQGLL